jgi:plasmid stabilization system protein ParE
VIYRVEVTNRARDDLAGIAEFVLSRAPRQGAAWLERFEAAIATLSELPSAHPRAPENPGRRGEEIRQLLYGDKRYTYRVLFTIDNPRQMVFVLTVRRGQRLPAPGL